MITRGKGQRYWRGTGAQGAGGMLIGRRVYPEQLTEGQLPQETVHLQGQLPQETVPLPHLSLGGVAVSSVRVLSADSRKLTGFYSRVLPRCVTLRTPHPPPPTPSSSALRCSKQTSHVSPFGVPWVGRILEGLTQYLRASYGETIFFSPPPHTHTQRLLGTARGCR